MRRQQKDVAVWGVFSLGKAVDDMAAGGFGARFATRVTLGSRGLLLLGRPPMWLDRGSNSKLRIAQRQPVNPRPDFAVWE